MKISYFSFPREKATLKGLKIFQLHYLLKHSKHYMPPLDSRVEEHHFFLNETWKGQENFDQKPSVKWESASSLRYHH